MKHRLITLMLILLCGGVTVSPVYAQQYYFGKNKVSYSGFDWSYIQSRHFDIYSYQGGENIAEFTAEVAEDALLQLQDVYRYNLRNRVPILVYNSHNDFQQTNAIGEFMPEGVGGVTEIFKNRIVVPFEGNYEKFRHVIHHELNHAFINDMFYGESFPNRIYAVMQFQMPLWANEGLSEYVSRGWSTDHDDSMRDATINNYLEQASPYWGGNAIWNYIDETYGKEKVGEVVRRIRETSDVDDGLKRALGIDFEELLKQWKLFCQRRYWPELKDRKRPDEVAKQLTDHEEGDGVYNLSPSISPNGDKIAFFSTRDLYYDMYVMSAIDGKILDKLVEGNRSPEFEELHIIGPLNLDTPALSWSPDGRKIAFASKTGEFDALFITDIRTKKHTRYDFDLDGLWTPAWAPNGVDVAFVGSKNGRSDIYVCNVETRDLRNITDDIFSDSDPSWSPDGSRIAFNSDRGDYITQSAIPDDFDIWKHDFKQLDLYVMQQDGSGMERITNTPHNELCPVWYPDGNGLALISDEIGIGNIYLLDFATKQTRPITNMLTSALHLSWSQDGSKMTFSALNNSGYDVYMLKNPFEIESGELTLQNTIYFDQLRDTNATQAKRNQQREDQIAAANKVLAEGSVINPKEKGTPAADEFSSYVFDEKTREKEVKEETKTQERDTETEKRFYDDESAYKNSDGSYARKKYKLRFTPDAMVGGAGYDTYFGVQGQTMLYFSDLMGNHQVGLGAYLFGDLKNSSFSATYGYLEKKTDYIFYAAHQAYYLSNTFDFVTPVNQPLRIRDISFGSFLSRPFNRFTRAEFGLEYRRVSQAYLSTNNSYYYPIYSSGPETTVHLAMPTLSLIKDTTLPGYFGPMDGFRGLLRVQYSPPLAKSYSEIPPNSSKWGGFGFTTVLGDARKYFKMGENYSFMMRLTGGASFGRDPEAFYVGGIDNWLNRGFEGGIRDDLRSISFGHFITPLRGVDYYEMDGDRYTLANLEFRFPMLQYLLLGWPLPMGFANIRGAGFFDIGTAWFAGDGLPYYDQNGNIVGYSKGGFNMWKPKSDTDQRDVLDDLRYGFGFGVRGALFFIPVRWDVAWSHDGLEFLGPRYLWSIGLEY